MLDTYYIGSMHFLKSLNHSKRGLSIPVYVKYITYIICNITHNYILSVCVCMCVCEVIKVHSRNTFFQVNVII